MAGTSIDIQPRFITGTEAQILALTTSSPYWYEYGFYFPTDKSYFYQAREGVMVKYGDGGDDEYFGCGILLNDKVIGGVKTLIESDDVLYIPENWDYNTFKLDIEGTVTCDGRINIMEQP